MIFQQIMMVWSGFEFHVKKNKKEINDGGVHGHVSDQVH